MKKIVINGDFLVNKVFAGVNRYAAEILYELDCLVKGDDVELLVPEYVCDVPEFSNIKIARYGKSSLMVWKNILLPKYAAKNNAILLDLSQAFPVWIKGSMVTCVHDCIPELVSTAYMGTVRRLMVKPLKIFQRKRALKKSERILTVSENSKKDIINVYGIKPEKIIVAGNAWQHINRVKYDDELNKKYNLLKNKYYFTLGSRVPHKNLKWIVEAAKQSNDEIFVVSGENTYYNNFEIEKFPDNIIFTGYITDAQIKSLMKECKAFLFPSFYEGFGIPPMEALSQGAKIIISDSSSLPEIYRNSAYYINPYDVSNIDLDEILKGEVDSPDDVLKRYSWKKTAEIVYETLKTVNSGKEI